MVMMNPDGSRCTKCEKKMDQVSSRIGHLQNAKYSYDSIKGEGAFARQEKTAMKALDILLKEKVNIATEHAMHDEEEEEKSETLYP